MQMDESFLSRGVNEGFSGGEKKRNEILQMLVLEPHARGARRNRFRPRHRRAEGRGARRELAARRRPRRAADHPLPAPARSHRARPGARAGARTHRAAPATRRWRTSSRSAATTGCSRWRDDPSRCRPIATRTGATPTCARSRRRASTRSLAGASCARPHRPAGAAARLRALGVRRRPVRRRSLAARAQTRTPRCSTRATPARHSRRCSTRTIATAGVGLRAGAHQRARAATRCCTSHRPTTRRR